MERKEIIKEKIQFVLKSLPKGEKKVAVYLLEQLEELDSISLPQIAHATGTSQATIVRLFKRMGYMGFREFKREWKDSISSPDEVSDPAVLIESETEWVMEGIIEENLQIMKKVYALITDEYDRAVDAILNAEVVNMIGNGDALIPCSLFGMKLMRAGINCWTSGEPSQQILKTASVKEKDVFLAVSYSGRSTSVVETMKKAQEKGAVTIGITGAAKAPLLKYCSIVIHTGMLSDTTGGDLISRRIAEQTIIETLYYKILNRMNEQDKSNRINIAEDINQMYMMQEEEGE